MPSAAAICCAGVSLSGSVSAFDGDRREEIEQQLARRVRSIRVESRSCRTARAARPR
jgi:DNA-binding IclR family transcriptional regulator